ncbi:MAG: M20/M25/M40 family metallo-hydrolase, partial [Chloroflexota bacterium]
ACSIVEALGGEVSVTIEPYGVGMPTINDEEATAVTFDGLHKLLGKEQVYEHKPVMGGEDFSAMLQKAPGCFMFLGVKNPEWEQEYPVHTPTFRIDERALAIGAASLAATAIEWMHQKG